MLLTVPRIKKPWSGGRSFSSLAPTYWNALSVHIRQFSDHFKFRKCLNGLFVSAAEIVVVGPCAKIPCSG